MGEVNLVEIGLEDFVPRIMALHFTRRGLFSKLAPQAPIRPIDQARMHVADQLLRYCACATRVAANGVFQRAGDSNEVDAIVLIEALIFDRDERLRYVTGH